MVITKLEDVTRQGSCKILWRKLRLRGSLLLVLIQFWGLEWGGGGGLFEFEWQWEGGGVGAYSRLGANSRLGAYSNKYGISLW